MGFGRISHSSGNVKHFPYKNTDFTDTRKIDSRKVLEHDRRCAL